MVRFFFCDRGVRLFAAALLALCLLALAALPKRQAQSAFFGMLFPQLVYGEATPGEAVAI